MRTTSARVIVIFFRKRHSESCLITAMFKVPSQQLRDTLATTFWKIAYSSIFYGRDFGKRHWNENWWRCLEKDQLRKNPSVYLEEHCTTVESTFYFFYALLFLSNLVFKFKIVPTGIFYNFHHNLLTFFAFWLAFDIRMILNFIQCLYAFL